MKNHALGIALIGILILSFLILFDKPKDFSNNEELDKLIDNEKVVIKGIVKSEREFGEDYILKLNNEIELICDCVGFEGKTIEVVGKVEEIYGERYVRVLRMNVIS